MSPALGTRLQTRWTARINPDRVLYAHQNRGGQFIDMSIVDVMEPGAAR